MASQEKRVKEELKEEDEVVQLNEQMESNNAAEEADDNSGDDSVMEDDVNEKSTDTAKRNRYRQYTQTTLGNAFQKVISREMSTYKASIVYGVPATTLLDRVKGKVRPETLSSGPQPLLSQEQEARLVNHIKKMSSLGYGYTRKEVTILATDYAVDLDLKGKDGKPLSLQWFRSFMKRWPELKTQRSRVKCTSQEVVDSFFDELETILTKNNLKDKPHCIYNIDEKCLSPEHTPPKFIVDSSAQSPDVTSERDNTTTIICAGNASGKQIPPYLVFAGQRMRQELLLGCTTGTSGNVSPTGWSNTEIFKTYLEKHFMKYVKGLSADQPIIVLYDCHKSHVSLGVIEWAKAHNIILFVFPAHTSHLLQPLDVGCFGPLSGIYNNCKITRYNIGELGTNAYVKGLSPENLRSSFRQTGIYPLNKSPYPPQVYLPSTVCTQTMTDITTDKNDTEEHALDTHDKTDEQNANTLPLTPIQTDRIDSSPPVDLSPDVTQKAPTRT